MEYLLIIFINASFSKSFTFKELSQCEAARTKIESLNAYGVNKPVFTAVCVEGGREN